ncbi:aftiphilin a isoform X2 [Eucyclogobius newberryi]|uniref:aftiphilin a isoform X2 n=1 Tax=Eucyclogobius newberryi TaxID=166745 RepID=UPI003B5A6338
MEPGVTRMFSSSPPPMDDALEEDEDEFGDFGTFSAVAGVPASISFSELETPTTFNQTRALNATSPPDLAHSRGPVGVAEAGRANGGPGRSEKTPKHGPNGERTAETLTNGFTGSPQRSAAFSQDDQHDFADFSAFSDETNTETLAETLDDKHNETLAETLDDKHNETLAETLDDKHNETLAETLDDKHETLAETLDDKHNETLAETLDDKHNETLAETLDDKHNETLAETLDDKHNETLAETLDEKHNETLAETLDDKHNETLAETLDDKHNETLAETLDEKHNETLAETLDDKHNETLAETLDDKHNAVKQDVSNRTDVEFANFAVFSKDSEGTLCDRQRGGVTESEERAALKDHSIPNRTEPIFTDLSAFLDDCTLENDFTGSGTVCKDEDIAFYFKNDVTQINEDCSSVNGNDLDASGSVCSSDLASESDCGVGNGEKPAVMVNGTAEKDGSETETETSLGRPLSTDALEEFGDMSTTGSVPSPPLQEETATPTGDEEEFGEFGDDAEQNQVLKAQEQKEEPEEEQKEEPKEEPEFKPEFSTSESFVHLNSSATEPEEVSDQSAPEAEPSDPFGDFSSPKANDQSEAEFPESQSFGNFSSAETTDKPSNETQPQNALKLKKEEEEQQQEEEEEQQEEDALDEFGDFNTPTFKTDVESEDRFSASDSFGRFGLAAAAGEGGGEGAAAAGGGGAEEEEETGWSAFGNENANNDGGEAWAAFSSEVSEEPSRAEPSRAEPSRAEPSAAAVNTAPLVVRLQQLFSASFPQIDAPFVDDEAPTLRLLLDSENQAQDGSVCVRVWALLEDIHEALGLRFQWGGSCCNKALLGSLGIDTRNILFTGQKKQPVIVPMYAAGLGMLEPVKPVSAAEMIASIAQNSPCSSESVQEALPPVQFDWSSSGLTNPLDAGVDPELFELTTAKLDSNRKPDAFARLMSTVQATSTARRPRPEENLSQEALKVISRFPDLSFMTAKVLMFPPTLTPHRAPGAEAESGPGLENRAD